MKKSFKITIVLLIVALIALAAWYGATLAGIRAYNDTVRSDKTDPGLSVTIEARGDASSSWTKDFADGTQATAKIYEMTVTNVSDCEISEWTERFDVKTDCWLNNGWCGKFEIRQKVHGVEKSATIDLRNYKKSMITVDYQMEDQDLMIPLHAGDTVTYLPSKEVFETPLQKGGSATVGIILYYGDAEPDFSGAEASFKYNKVYTQTLSHKLQLSVLCAWGVVALITLSLYIYSVRTDKKMAEQEQRLEECFRVFSGFVDAKDAYTNGHSRRVARYARKIAEAMGYSREAARNVYYTGLMHDCGKCFIPDEVLKKPGRLTNEEFALIKTHPTHGAELLQDFKSLENIKQGALYHHERFDGKGYPSGLAGKQIPEIGRILGVADAFDAMNSKRVYRDQLSEATIMGELRNGRGTQFDPDILDVFLRMIESGEIKMNEPHEL